MNIATCLNKNSLYIAMEGELDQGVATCAKEEIDMLLDSKSYRNVVFDMSKLNFMDSTGIGLILGRYKKLKKKSIPVYITSPNSQIDKIIRVSGLYTIIPLV